MASLKDIRKRITSVKNTQKITRAMKLVAAAKLRRAQDAIVAARPYAVSLEEVVADLAGKAGADSHPLLAKNEGKRVQIVVMTADRGLAGAFNAQIIRAVEAFIRDELADHDDIQLRLVGKKGNDYFKRRTTAIRAFREAPTGDNALDFAGEMANELTVDFLGAEPNPGEKAVAKPDEAVVDKVYLFYNEFVSAISTNVNVTQLLPIEPKDVAEGAASASDFIYEPSKEELLEHLLPRYLQIQLYRAALESVASELGSRMSAMDNATRNAGDMIDKLTLKYNRARQAAITTELGEIISGAESLKG